ncbi:type IV pilus biogenesis protein PilM [Pseudomonas sp. WS 5532]|nr:type IV pilus biogenesis protein PilM [Pseudomonas sp. WS 5532]
MQMLWTLFAILGLAGSLMLNNLEFWQDTDAQGEIAAIGGSMRIYKTALVAYQSNNPAAAGAVADSQLGLPSWYRKTPGIGNVIVGDQAYVFYTQNMPGLASYLYKQSDNSIRVGIKQNGGLYNPGKGYITPLPNAIPDGSIVY